MNQQEDERACKEELVVENFGLKFAHRAASSGCKTVEQ